MRPFRLIRSSRDPECHEVVAGCNDGLKLRVPNPWAHRHFLRSELSRAPDVDGTRSRPVAKETRGRPLVPFHDLDEARSRAR
jgi:hypothetical protein